MKLLTNGCSFTEGYDLSSPVKAWPAVLANNIGYDLANIGLGGASNFRIFRTTIEYLNENEVDLVLVGWTFHDRSELTHASGQYLRLTSNACLPDTSEFNENLSHVHKFWVTDLYNQYLNFRSWIHSVLHLQDYFSSKKISYKFFTALGNDYVQEFLNDTDSALAFADQSWQWRDRSKYEPCREIHAEYQELQRLIKKINLDNWIGKAEYTMDDYLSDKKFQTDSTGHFLEDGHAAWAKHLEQFV